MTFGSARGAYPERTTPRPTWLDRTGSRLAAPLARWRRTVDLRRDAFLRAVRSGDQWAADLTGDGLRVAAADLGVRLRRAGFPDPLVARCFSLVREAAGRSLGLRHFDVQLVGGRLLLRGMVAEMETGEGKTLTATLAAATAAVAGVPVHVITVNDYLTERDARVMAPVYEALGLRVGVIVHGLPPEARRDAYRADVTYCTNKEIAFDYLRDRVTLGRDADRARLAVERLYERRPRLDRLLLRGLFYGIVDEADSVLVDEARTPLIISGPSGESTQEEICRTALSIAAGMMAGRDFVVEERERRVRLLPPGLATVETAAAGLEGVWARRHWRDDLVTQALTATHLFQEGQHYLVQDGRIQIIDEYTGRVMPDRSWEHGLHQMIEVKEGCTMTRRVDPLARISYQRFFGRYHWLAGMTGTAREVAGELWSVYRLATACVPTNRPVRRMRWPDRICATKDEKWRTVVDRIEEVHAAGRPVLVGTRSVEASEHLSALLHARGLPHQLLNARQDLDEARVVERAGERGRITVATNMAGRGTDIQLTPEVVPLGGLHVIATELHEARRIDRQLFGRCGRQGDPGTCEAILSMEDELVEIYGPRLARAVRLPPALILRLAQRSAEGLHRRMRRDLLSLDEHMETTLAFSGGQE